MGCFFNKGLEMKIYIVEDDLSISKLIEYALKSKNYNVKVFENGNDFFLELEKGKPDLVLLDIMLPDINGIEILERIRKNSETEEIPVIMITAKNTEIDIITSLDKGADDYICKPFSVLELLSRINARLRRIKKEENTLEIKGLKIDKPGRNVYINNVKINLTLKEYELLLYLVDNSEIVLSREKIINTIWGYDYIGESRTIDMHIKSLREKLTEYGKYIKTIRGIGYKFSIGDQDGA